MRSERIFKNRENGRSMSPSWWQRVTYPCSCRLRWRSCSQTSSRRAGNSCGASRFVFFRPSRSSRAFRRILRRLFSGLTVRVHPFRARGKTRIGNDGGGSWVEELPSMGVSHFSSAWKGTHRRVYESRCEVSKKRKCVFFFEKIRYTKAQ